MDMNFKTFTGLLIICLMAVGAASAAELRSEHTWQLAEGEQSPAATLQDAHWLVGSWTGTAFGSRFEEVWNPPSAGSMVGMFKLLDDDGVKFYELVLLNEEDGTLSLKVKHFNADFTAWEDKEEYVDFRLVKKEPGALHFTGLSFYYRDADHFDGYLLTRNGDKVTENKLSYVRADR
jgi:hypothetical protein